MKKALIITSLLLPITAHAVSPEVAANKVLSESTLDAKCERFFDYFMSFATSNQLYKNDQMIKEIDKKNIYLVDQCDSNSEKYLKKYR